MYNSFHKPFNSLSKVDFITRDNFDELLISATSEIKEGTVECDHSSRRRNSHLKICRYPEKPNLCLINSVRNSNLGLCFSPSNVAFVSSLWTDLAKILRELGP